VSREKEREKLDYMHANQSKNNLADHPRDWPWSKSLVLRDRRAGTTKDRCQALTNAESRIPRKTKGRVRAGGSQNGGAIEASSPKIISSIQEQPRAVVY
jgi:hypothetical protein